MNNIIPAVDKSVQLLLTLAQHPCTQSTLSQTLHISMSTCYRILMTLQHHHWVKKAPGGIYSLSHGIFPLVESFPQDLALLDRAERQVSHLSEKHQIACKLSIRSGIHQLTRFRAEPSGPVALTGQVHSTFPLIEGSVGAALLSQESPDDIQELIEQCSEDIPEKQNPALLSAALSEVRARGTVLNLRPNRWHIAACSIPLHNQSGEVVAALTIIGMAEDFVGGKRKQWDKILKKAAARCEA